MSKCLTCGSEEYGNWTNNPLHNGLCEDCLAWLFDYHRTECTDWWVNEIAEKDNSYDLTPAGARQFCLRDDLHSFSEWLVTEHTDWIWGLTDVIRNNTWRWLDAFDRFR